MYRIIKLSNKWYGLEIDDIEDDLENLQIFSDEGTPILIVDEVKTACEVLAIDIDDITIAD